MTNRPVDRHLNHLHRLAKSSVKPASVVKKSGWKYLLTVFFLACFCVTGTYYYLNPPYTIDIIRIDGQYPHVNRNALTEVLSPYANRPLFLFRATSLQKNLQKLPWIETISVHRDWPHILCVVLHEPIIVARIGTNQLLTQSGRVIPLASDYADFSPQLNIASASATPTSVFMQYKQLQALLTPLNVRIVQVHIDPRGTWGLTLDNGMLIIIGRDEQQQQIRRLATVYARVFGDKGNTVAYVDMRYTNGMAVHWKSATPSETAAPTSTAKR